ncbi:MAG: NADH-dependent alcohol dehydrogenase, partial [Bacteroides sp.]
IVYPGTLRTLSEKKHEKMLQYAQRIWGITTGIPDIRINQAIEKTEEFFRSLGLSTRLGEENIGDDTILEIERRFNERHAAYGEDGDVTGAVAKAILMNCK